MRVLSVLGAVLGMVGRVTPQLTREQCKAGARIDGRLNDSVVKPHHVRRQLDPVRHEREGCDRKQSERRTVYSGL